MLNAQAGYRYLSTVDYSMRKTRCFPAIPPKSCTLPTLHYYITPCATEIPLEFRVLPSTPFELPQEPNLIGWVHAFHSIVMYNVCLCAWCMCHGIWKAGVLRTSKLKFLLANKLIFSHVRKPAQNYYDVMKSQLRISTSDFLFSPGNFEWKVGTRMYADWLINIFYLYREDEA